MSGDFPMFHTCDKVGSWLTIIVDVQIDVWNHYSKHCLTFKVIGKCWWGMDTSFIHAVNVCIRTATYSSCVTLINWLEWEYLNIVSTIYPLLDVDITLPWLLLITNIKRHQRHPSQWFCSHQTLKLNPYESLFMSQAMDFEARKRATTVYLVARCRVRESGKRDV